MVTPYLFRPIILITLIFVLLLTPAFACEVCSIPQIGKNQGALVESKDKKWFGRYRFEYQDWHTKEPGEAHGLHHQGHHFHNKVSDFDQHFEIGHHLTDELTVNIDFPYVVHEIVEIDDHTILGSKETSEGWGDIWALAQYRVFFQENHAISVVGGVKFPSGTTNEKNSIGTLFEPEIQPGTGSFDYVIGSVYRQEFGRWDLTGNIAYVFKTEGDHDYKFGDVFSTSVVAEYVLNPDAKNWVTKFGLDVNMQYEQKHEEEGNSVKDSGGTTILLGPTFNVMANQYILFFGQVGFPVYQNLGGVHQELDLVSTLGLKVNW